MRDQAIYLSPDGNWAIIVQSVFFNVKSFNVYKNDEILPIQHCETRKEAFQYLRNNGIITESEMFDGISKTKEFDNETVEA